ncbi:isopeptide-forming domain-containing fimbrial protein [Nostoc spongiaeforme]|uniref:isopeptide-forming domain-containing fimbrial protein n=1 Tax=Nostoc spongiaeforme TaxID=502487 RepID=UPI0036F292E7
MNHPCKKKQITFGINWNQRLTKIVFLVSFLHTSAPIVVTAQDTRVVNLTNQATYTYTYQDNGQNIPYQGTTSQLQLSPSPLVDPSGRILGCGGTPLADYTGFSVGIYEPNPSDPTGTELGQLLSLTRTEIPDIPSNNIPGGQSPNSENSNPFSITNNPAGFYNFLLDPNRGQTDPGRQYILVINPPANSIYQQRRIKIEIIDRTGTGNNSIVRYAATSLDGQPIRITGETRVEDSVVVVPNAEVVGLDLLAFALTTNMCQAQQLQIIKTGDRATAEPGDTVIYRISVKNVSDTTLNNLVVTDTLPLGFNFINKSVRGELNGQAVNITTDRNGNTVTFRTDVTIPSQTVVNIAYAAQITPDAVRGTGRNSAIARVLRTDNNLAAKDGPATHQLVIRPGIVADCGTIIGRVFEDKNFDGEQQNGEPGIPNAVIFLENGNRITTDPNGLFSVANVLPGSHTGVLDLSSIPGYTLAPNHKFRERNTQSRWVRLEPGGLVRMNFAVTPSKQE